MIGFPCRSKLMKKNVSCTSQTVSRQLAGCEAKKSSHWVAEEAGLTSTLKCCACRWGFTPAFQACDANESSKLGFMMGMSNGLLDHTRVNHPLREANLAYWHLPSLVRCWLIRPHGRMSCVVLVISQRNFLTVLHRIQIWRLYDANLFGSTRRCY